MKSRLYRCPSALGCNDAILSQKAVADHIVKCQQAVAGAADVTTKCQKAIAELTKNCQRDMLAWIAADNEEEVGE